jgi:hypothetical protein
MVEKTMLTSGTTINTMFSKLSTALLLFSSIWKRLMDTSSRKRVYARTTLFRKISYRTYLDNFSMTDYFK